MSPKLFISYRHGDEAEFVKKVCKYFKDRFGDENVFLDPDIPPGANWRDTLKQGVLKSDAVIVMIGPRWLDLFDEKRTSLQEDYVYFELELAIRNKKRLFPICLQGAKPPSTDKLPEALRPLLDFQFSFLSEGATFPTDIDILLDQVEAQFKTPTTSIPTPPLATSLPLVQTCPTPPPEPDRFGGRSTALAKLCDSLKSGKFSALTAVHGLGGIGKTTLATKAASDLFKQKVFRSVLYAKITREPDPVAILETWARDAYSHYIRPADAKPDDIAHNVKRVLEDTINAKCEQCESPRVLVFLDDVWNDSDGRGKAAVKLIRQACPVNATVLLTTRFEGLAIDLGANPQSLDRLTPAEGAELLQTYAYLENADASALQALSESLGGHALALDIAARRIGKAANKSKALRDHTADYEKRIPLGEQFKAIKLDQGDTREDNLTLVLSYSYDDLAPDDQARFRQLGILPSDVPFDQSMLAAIWGVEQAAVEEYCDTLRLSSLLEPALDAGDGWYRQHRLLRAYALALLRDAGELDTIFARYADHCIAIARNFIDLPPEQWLSLNPYLPHIHAVGAGLVARTDPLPTALDETLLKRAQVFALNTSRYLNNRREVRQIDWTQMGLRTSQALQDDQQQARYLNDLGSVYDALGDKRQALDYYEQALPIRRAVGDRRGEATTLNNLGSVYDALGDKRQALDYYEQALPILRAVGDRRGEATTLNNVGSVYSALGDKRQALDYYEQALPIIRAVGDRSGEATTLNNLGWVYDALGDKRQALDYYEQALPILRAVGDRRGEAATLNNLGSVYSALGDKRQALDYYEQALPIIRAVGDRSGEAATCFNIGMIYRSQGDLDKAIEYVARCVELDEQVEHPDLDSDRRMLEQLKHERDGGSPSEADQMQAVMQTLLTMYRQNGADAVRTTLKQANLPDETIEAVLAQLSTTASNPPAAQTLPADTINTLAGNTLAVKTTVPDKLTEWRARLQSIRADFAANHWQSELYFADALLAILDAQPVTLPDSNPYHAVVQQIVTAIADYHKGT